MKKITSIALLFCTVLSYAQVGINTDNPDTSSALDIESSTGGILIPRLTQTERDAIPFPATGLMIYQEDQTAGFYFFDGATWTSIVDGNAEATDGNKYLALVDFDVSESIVGINMVDPSGNGTFLTSGITTFTSTGGNLEKFAEFSFTNENSAPSAIIIYAADMNNAKYKITHLNSGGDNSSYEITGVTFNNTSGNNYDSDLFSGFGAATIKLDLTKSNIDYVRDSTPPQFKEAHAYILFQF